ncbi:hypothetical protein Tco_1514570 [Tanacetum coccineum]
MHKVQNNNDNYNVFAMENEHPEQPESSNDIYLTEQGDTNITIDSSDICYDRAQDDQDETDDLDQERDLLASLIQKLKCEIDDSKNRNKFLESSNKELVDKLKGEIEDFKTKNKRAKAEGTIDCDAISLLKDNAYEQLKSLMKVGLTRSNLAVLMVPSNKTKQKQTMRANKELPKKPERQILQRIGFQSKDFVLHEKTMTLAVLVLVDNTEGKIFQGLYTNQYESAQTLDVSAGTSNLSAGTSFNPKKEELRVCSSLNPQCQKASDHVSSDPVPQCSTTVLEQDSLSPGPQSQENVPQVAETVTTSTELELLYSPMFSELLNGTSHVVSKSSAVHAADNPDKRQQHNTIHISTTTDVADPPPLNIHSTHQTPTQVPTVTAPENIIQAETNTENAQKILRFELGTLSRSTLNLPVTGLGRRFTLTYSFVLITLGNSYWSLGSCWFHHVPADCWSRFLLVGFMVPAGPSDSLDLGRCDAYGLDNLRS